MRKSVIDKVTIHPEQRSEQEWLELEQMAQVEVTSEDPNFPRPKRVSRSSASSLISRDRFA